jgi:excisionase family DNA binding protein
MNSAGRRYLSVGEFAAEFGFHPMSVRRMIDHKKIPFIRIGRSIRVDRRLLDEEFERQRQGVPARTRARGAK